MGGWVVGVVIIAAFQSSIDCLINNNSTVTACSWHPFAKKESFDVNNHCPETCMPLCGGAILLPLSLFDYRSVTDILSHYYAVSLHQTLMVYSMRCNESIFCSSTPVVIVYVTKNIFWMISCWTDRQQRFAVHTLKYLARIANNTASQQTTSSNKRSLLNCISSCIRDIGL